jgi:ribosomal protein S18 acetylase RimI-like enzyme
MAIQLIQSRDLGLLLPLLRDAEEGDERIIQTIEDPAATAYIAQNDDTVVGAAVMRWAHDESEIVYIATVSSLRGQGHGKAIMSCIIAEAQQKRVQAICVGTANSSWANIAFYQKCGFRMDSVRKDFFNYLPTPLVEDGIKMQDMLVLRLSLDGG